MSEANELVLELEGGMEREGGDRISGALRLAGPWPARRPSGRVFLRRRVRRGERAILEEELLEEREFKLEEEGQSLSFGPFELPAMAFSYEGEHLRVRWAVVAELRLAGQAEPLRRALPLEVRPAPGRGEPNAATLAAWKGRLSADRSGELTRLVGYGLFSCVFFGVAAGAGLGAAGGSGPAAVLLAVAVLALGFGGVLVWLHVLPRLDALKRRATAPAIKRNVVACGEELPVPDAGKAAPRWQLVLVERTHHTRRMMHGRNDWTKHIHNEQRRVIAEGRGAGTPVIPEAGPPTTSFGDARLDWEVCFFAEGQAEAPLIRDLLVLPWRLGG